MHRRIFSVDEKFRMQSQAFPIRKGLKIIKPFDHKNVVSSTTNKKLARKRKKERKQETIQIEIKRTTRSSGSDMKLAVLMR